MTCPTVRISVAIAWGLWALATTGVTIGTVCLSTGHHFVALSVYAFSFLLTAAAAATTIRACMEHATRDIINAVEINRDLMPGVSRVPGIQHIPLKRG